MERGICHSHCCPGFEFNQFWLIISLYLKQAVKQYKTNLTDITNHDLTPDVILHVSIKPAVLGCPLTTTLYLAPLPIY